MDTVCARLKFESGQNLGIAGVKRLAGKPVSPVLREVATGIQKIFARPDLGVEVDDKEINAWLSQANVGVCGGGALTSEERLNRQLALFTGEKLPAPFGKEALDLFRHLKKLASNSQDLLILPFTCSAGVVQRFFLTAQIVNEMIRCLKPSGMAILDRDAIRDNDVESILLKANFQISLIPGTKYICVFKTNMFSGLNVLLNGLNSSSREAKQSQQCKPEVNPVK